MPQLARRMSRAKPSVIMQVAEKAKRLKAEGRDIISFSIGVPNFLPGEHVYAAAREALAKDSGQYGSNRGTDALLDAFIEHMAKIGMTGYGRVNCSTGIGAKHILYNLGEALLDEGDTLMFPVPYWTTYLDIAEILDARAVELPCPASQNYKLTPAQLDAALAEHKPKVFLFNNPSNPTGMVYTRDEIAALAEVLVKYPDTWIITDDIYNRMLFDGLEYANFVMFRPELRGRVIFVDSLSKTYGMPGWRVGFMAGPESVAKAVTTLNSNHITNVPEIATAAAIAALSGPQDVPTEKCADERDPGRGLPASAGRVLRVPGHQLRVRQVAQRHEDRKRRRSLQCAAGSQGRGLRAGFGVRRAARAAHQLHLPDAAAGSRPGAVPGVLCRIGVRRLVPPAHP
jgi:aspartate aminotransferase